MWKPRLSVLRAQKALREGRKILQKEIIEATGIRQPTISEWMQPDTRFSRIDAEVAGKLAEYFGCDPRELFEYAPQKEEDKDEAELAGV